MKGEKCAQGRDRTSDTRIFSPLLYQLSYLGIVLVTVGAHGYHGLRIMTRDLA